jgi:RND family efflux transporter MFP subunit
MKRTVVLTVALLAASCGGEAPPRSGPAAEPVAVVVTPAWQDAAPAVVVAQVESERAADLATRASGTLRSVDVRVGDRVRAGQTLAVLDDADVRARIAGARAQRELAERTFGRVERLAADGAASGQELDEARARRDAAVAGAAEAEAQEAYVEVRAPFDGVVVGRFADPGDLAVPGRPVLRVAGRGPVKVVADLPSELAAGTALGDAVTIRTGDGTGVAGTIAQVVPTLDPATRRFRIEVTPATSAGLAAGAIVALELPGRGGGSRWIAADALVRRGQMAGVWALEGDTVRLRWLALGRTIGDAVEVLSGPPGPLTVVRRPGADLRDGAPAARVTREPAPRPDSLLGAGGVAR